MEYILNDTSFDFESETLSQGAISKRLLARSYLPEKSARLALRTLNKWINHHRVLSGKLAETGYTTHQRLLTPQQVRLIVQYLGEP